jgi:hypothetical protein
MGIGGTVMIFDLTLDSFSESVDFLGSAQQKSTLSEKLSELMTYE